MVIFEFTLDQSTSMKEARDSLFHISIMVSCKEFTVPTMIAIDIMYRAWDIASMMVLWHICSPDIPKQIGSLALWTESLLIGSYVQRELCCISQPQCNHNQHAARWFVFIQAGFHKTNSEMGL